MLVLLALHAVSGRSREKIERSSRSSNHEQDLRPTFQRRVLPVVRVVQSLGMNATNEALGESEVPRGTDRPADGDSLAVPVGWVERQDTAGGLTRKTPTGPGCAAAAPLPYPWFAVAIHSAPLSLAE